MDYSIFPTLGRLWRAACMAMVMATGMTVASAAPMFSLELLPSTGAISAAAGATNGWGYRLINSGDDYLVPTSLSADLFVASTPWALFDFPTVAPHSVVERQYLLDATGLFQFTWAHDATVGTINMGKFVIDARWYPADPLAGGVDIGSAGTATADYLAQVSQPTVVPEPASVPLLLAAVVLMAARLKKPTLSLKN